MGQEAPSQISTVNINDQVAPPTPGVAISTPQLGADYVPQLSLDVSETVENADDFEDETPALTYADAIATVYRLIKDEEHCPTQPLPKPRVRSLLEREDEPIDFDIPTLPHSSTVKAMADSLEKDSGLDLTKTGSLITKEFLKRLGPRSYKVHTENWPIRNPPLDRDATKVGIRTSSTNTIPPQLSESLESRSRSMVSMTSHLDLFLAALGKGMRQGENLETLSLLLQSAAKTSRHLMGSAMSMSADFLLCRRDAAIASATILPGRGREILRSCPLTANTLLGDKCSEVAAADLVDRQRNLLSTTISKLQSQPSQSRYSGYPTHTPVDRPTMNRVPPTGGPSRSMPLQQGARGRFPRSRGRGDSGRGRRFSRSRPRRGNF